MALLDLVVQGLLVLLGLAFLLSPSTLVHGFGFADGQSWTDLAFALPLAMLAYTGLETIANLAEEAREPGRDLPRALFSAIGLVVLVTVLIGRSACRRIRARTARRRSASSGSSCRSSGSPRRSTGRCRQLVDVLKLAVGVSGALILVAAATTSVSGITRLTYSLAEHGRCRASSRGSSAARWSRARRSSSPPGSRSG